MYQRISFLIYHRNMLPKYANIEDTFRQADIQEIGGGVAIFLQTVKLAEGGYLGSD